MQPVFFAQAGKNFRSGMQKSVFFVFPNSIGIFLHINKRIASHMTQRHGIVHFHLIFQAENNKIYAIGALFYNIRNMPQRFRIAVEL